MQFVLALSEGLDERKGDSLLTFRNALGTYKAGKTPKPHRSKGGRNNARSIFESLRRARGEKPRGQSYERSLADSLYNDLEEELALAALRGPLAHAPHQRKKSISPRTSSARARRGGAPHSDDP